MKRLTKLLGLMLLMCMFFSCDNGESEEDGEGKMVDIETVAPTDTVLICTGSAAKRFHSRDNCEGMQSCTKAIKPVTRAEAEAKKRTPCIKCYRIKDAE